MIGDGGGPAHRGGGASVRLRFRRHLALLGLVWLLHELLERPTSSHFRSAQASPEEAVPEQEESATTASNYYRWLPLIYLNYSLLPVGSTSRFPSQALDEQVAHYYDQDDYDDLQQQQATGTSLDQLRLLAIKAALRTAPLLVHSSWGYTEADKRVSGGPAANRVHCLEQLAHLEGRLTRAQDTGQQDLALASLLDTYGRVPSQLLRGNTKWLGSYAGCLDTQLDIQQQPAAAAANLSLGEHHETTQPPTNAKANRRRRRRRIKFRYCLAALGSRHWPHSTSQQLPQLQLSTGTSPPPPPTSKWINYGVGTHHFNLELFFYRLGVCLPEACDSQVFADHQQARASISRLAKHNLLEPFSGPHYQLTDLYCLPDERSPLRQLSLGARLFLGFVLLWLALILFLSSSLPKYLWKTRPAPLALIDDCALRNNWRRYTRQFAAASQSGPQAHQIEAVSVTSGVEDTHSKAPKRKQQQQARNSFQLVQSATTNTSSGIGPQQQQQITATCRKRVGGDTKVDTSCLNALKVVCLSWLMAAHCVIYLGSAVANPGLLKLYARSLASYALSMGAIYITEAFFVITGCLTAYIIFNHHHSSSSSSSSRSSSKSSQPTTTATKQQPPKRQPLPWLLLALNRYLRILPIYLLVYAYVRLVSLKWGGSGPQWDYAVSDNSQRRQCLRESWLPTLTLTTNYLNLYEHCILAGWYLSVDMQFTLLAIPLLLLLEWAFRSGSSGEGISGSGLAVGRKKLAYAILILTIVGSACASVLSLILQAQVDLSYLLKLYPHSIAMLTSSLGQYTNPMLRFRAYAMGLLTGHLLHLYELGDTQHWLPIGWFQHHKTGLTVGCLVGCFGTMFAPLLYPSHLVVVSHDVTALLMVASASFIDLSLSVWIFLLCTGLAPTWLLKVLRAPAWSLLSSLSLTALLIHTELIILLTSQLDPPPGVGYSLVLFVFSATLLITYPIALALHLFFERPLHRLITRCILRSRPPQANSNPGNNKQ